GLSHGRRWRAKWRPECSQRWPRRRRHRAAMLGSSPSDLVLPVALLEDVADESEESGGVRAVERTVIPRQREITDWSHAHRPPAGAIGDGGGTHPHTIGREDGHLWWVDDGRTHHRAVAARIGDGERAAA